MLHYVFSLIAIYSGDTIGLQSYNRNIWLWCSGWYCQPSPQNCPAMEMSGSDWTECTGAIFRIYKTSGTGPVLSGDPVGIYSSTYTIYYYWLYCVETATCAKSECPGNPTTHHGFDNEDKCQNYVFRIYVKGKGEGSSINSSDDIALYHPVSKS